MSNRAAGRWALTIAVLALTALSATQSYACNGTVNCPSNASNLDGVAANALPTYPEATEEASEPVRLKKFTKPQVRSARRTPRKPAATLAQRARAGQIAAQKAKQEEEAAAKVRNTTDKTIATVLANANAALLELDTKTAPKASTAAVNEPPAAAEPTATPAEPQSIEMVSADEFNELDRAAWDANQMPKLMKLQAIDSRAELREDDSKWAQTSTIGKLFVAFGALLTIGSAIRMFMA